MKSPDNSQAGLNLERENYDSRKRRYRISSALRYVNGTMQAIGALKGGSFSAALAAEAVEELADGAAFGSAANQMISRSRGEQGMYYHWRSRVAKFILAAALFSSAEAAYEIVHEGFQEGEWTERMEGIETDKPVSLIPPAALLIGAGVMAANANSFKKKYHHDGTDTFVKKDALRDLLIPGSVTALMATRAPHYAEFAVEGLGAAYSWKIYTGFRQSAIQENKAVLEGTPAVQ